MNIVAHNLSAMNAQRQFGINTRSKTKSTEKLSSGYKINRAADDAAGLSISEKMRRQIRGLTQGVENTQDGVSLCQVADGALAEVNDMLHRITELSVKSANGTNSEQDRQYIQEEINQILQEIDRIGETTSFNNIKLFSNGTVDANQGNTPVNPSNTPVVPTPTNYITPIQNSLSITGTPNGMTTGIKTIAVTDSEISIAGDSFLWSDFKTSSGDSLESSAISAGIYSMNYKGMQIAFEIQDGAEASDVVQALNGTTFQVSSQSQDVTIARIKDLEVHSGSNNDGILEHYTSVQQSNQYKRTMFFTDDTGITLKAFGGVGLGYSNTISTVSWASMGITDWANVGGTYTFDDSVSGLKFTFEVEPGTTKEELKSIFDLASFEVIYDDGGKVAVKGNSIVNTQLAEDIGIKATGLNVTHDVQVGDFYEYFGYDSASEKLGGIDVEVYLTNANGTLQAKYVSNGQEKTSIFNSSVTDNLGNREAIFGGFSNSMDRLTLIVKNTGISASEKENAINDFLNANGNTVKLADIHIDDFYDYKINDVKAVRKTTFTVGNVNVQTYVPPSSPGQPSSPNPSTPSDNPSVKEGVLSLWIQSGCEAGDGIWLEIDNMNTSILGIEGVDVSTVSGANYAIDAVKGALQKVTANRSKIGAQQNRLEHTIANEENVVENTTAAESRIRDTDMAKEMVKFSNINILEQVGHAMMAQANQSNQGVLSLLQ